MTKKDYVLIASVFANHDNEIRSIADVAEGLADMLERDNPRFDRSRFLKACGIEQWSMTGLTRTTMPSR